MYRLEAMIKRRCHKTKDLSRHLSRHLSRYWGASIVLLAVCVAMVGSPSRAFADQNLSAAQAYEAARKGYFRLKAAPKAKQLRHRWLQSIAAFAQVDARHGDSVEAIRARYTVATLWRDMYHISHLDSDLAEATAAFLAFAAHNPNHEESSKTRVWGGLADDALWLASGLLIRSGDFAAAGAVLQTLEKDFAAGDMASRGRARFAKIQKDIDAAQASGPQEDVHPALALTHGQVVGRTHGASGSLKTDAILEKIQWWSNRSYTRLVVYLSGPAQAKVGRLPASKDKNQPARLYLDMAHTQRSAQLPPEVKVKDALLQRVRAAQFTPHAVRVVLDLKVDIQVDLVAMENPYRLVLDVRPAADKHALSERGNKNPNKNDQAQKPSSQAKKWHVILDAGHGGKDGGAQSANGRIQEKTVVAQITSKLRKRLVARGFVVSQTRPKDVFVPLEARMALANRAGGDAFVSIHANAAPQKHVWGIETYFLDITSNKDALRRAAIENATNMTQVHELQPKVAQNRRAMGKRSHKLAQLVQKHVVASLGRGKIPVRNLGVKPSLFYVLVGAQMPAVLVETGFLSHAEESKRLTRSAYQERIAAGIEQALVEAFLKAPASKR